MESINSKQQEGNEMNESISSAEESYRANSGSALLAYQSGEISYSEWNSRQAEAVTAYYASAAKSGK